MAVGLNFVGESDFPTKRFFWSSTATNWAFAELPKPLAHLGKGLFERIQSIFTGEFDRVLIDVNGKPSSDYSFGAEISIEADKLELEGRKGVTELDRLAYVIHAIEKEC